MAITFETIPPEIRFVIYSHLLANPTIRIHSSGRMNILNYPYQITIVSRLIRQETLPLLREAGPHNRTRLICDGGHFPASVRRRLPSYIFRCTRYITICSSGSRNVGTYGSQRTAAGILYDELKPTISTFPNLETLDFDLRQLVVSMRRMLGRHTRRLGRQEEDTAEEIRCLEVRWALQDMYLDMHVEQEQPREGLECDYFVHDTMYSTLLAPRLERGFRIIVAVDLLAFQNDLGTLPGVKFDWDDIDDS